MLLRILLYKKQRLPRKYLLQLYSNCCYTELWQNLTISSTTWRRARTSYLHTRAFLHKSSHIIFRILCVTSVDAFVLLYKRFISSLYIKFLYTFSNFLSSLSCLCLQEFGCLVEEQDCQLFAKTQSCSRFRF